MTITLAELHAALTALRYPPIRRNADGASGHYEQDHDAHAKAIVQWIAARRKAQR